jgi:hypothetical protein
LSRAVEAALAEGFRLLSKQNVFPAAYLLSQLRNHSFGLSGTLRVSFSPALGRGSKLAITNQRGSALELTIPCETYAIARLGKKSRSSSC